jgi:hypothetical protein
MHRNLRGIALVCSFLVLTSGLSAAQPPEEETADEVFEVDASAEQMPKVEVRREVLNISVRDGLLSVELENAGFGTVIQLIGKKADFATEGSGDSFGKELTMRFSNVELERGVMRLLTFVRENNYLMHYDAEGRISSLEILSSTAANPVGPAVRPSQPSRPPSSIVQRQVPFRPRSFPPARPSPQRPQMPQPAIEDEPEVIEEEENVSEVPYIAPQPRRPALPSRRR